MLSNIRAGRAVDVPAQAGSARGAELFLAGRFAGGGVPLGLVYQSVWARKAAPKGRKKSFVLDPLLD